MPAKPSRDAEWKCQPFGTARLVVLKERVQVPNAVRQTSMVHELSIELSSVSIPYGRIRVKQVEARGGVRCGEQLAHQVIVWRKAVANA